MADVVNGESRRIIWPGSAVQLPEGAGVSSVREVRIFSDGGVSYRVSWWLRGKRYLKWLAEGEVDGDVELVLRPLAQARPTIPAPELDPGVSHG